MIELQSSIQRILGRLIKDGCNGRALTVSPSERQIVQAALERMVLPLEEEYYNSYKEVIHQLSDGQTIVIPGNEWPEDFFFRLVAEGLGILTNEQMATMLVCSFYVMEVRDILTESRLYFQRSVAERELRQLIEEHDLQRDDQAMIEALEQFRSVHSTAYPSIHISFVLRAYLVLVEE